MSTEGRQDTTPTPADNSDLSALWNTYVTARDALNTHKGDNEEGDRLAEASRSAEWAFLNAPAHTVAGIALKFRYLIDEFALDLSLRDNLPADVLKALDTAAEAAERLACVSSPLDMGAADAELLDLWSTYKRQFRFIDTLPEGDTPERSAAYEAMYATADRIEATPARTGAGLAAKLRMLFQGYHETEESDAAVIDGADMPADQIKDCRERMLWNLIAEAERITAAQPDAFADAIAAFEAEAPGMLSVPQIPTEAMEKAATQIAGITPEQFRYAYAAALEAFKEERAA